MTIKAKLPERPERETLVGGPRSSIAPRCSLLAAEFMQDQCEMMSWCGVLLVLTDTLMFTEQPHVDGD